MRWLSLTFIAVAMAFFVGLPTGSEARTTVRRTTSIDPVTGVRTTQVIKVKERGWNRGRHRGWNRGWHRGWRDRRATVRASTVVGAPIIVPRGFPRSPRDGQRSWRGGRLWAFDRDLGRWIIVR